MPSISYRQRLSNSFFVNNRRRCETRYVELYAVNAASSDPLRAVLAIACCSQVQQIGLRPSSRTDKRGTVSATRRKRMHSSPLGGEVRSTGDHPTHRYSWTRRSAHHGRQRRDHPSGDGDPRHFRQEDQLDAASCTLFQDAQSPAVVRLEQEAA